MLPFIPHEKAYAGVGAMGSEMMRRTDNLGIDGEASLPEHANAKISTAYSRFSKICGQPCVLTISVASDQNYKTTQTCENESSASKKEIAT